MGTITCFADQTSSTFPIINCLGLSDEDNSISRADNFVKVIAFNSVTSPHLHVLSYHCVLHYFLALPGGFNFNLTFRLKPQVGGIKIAIV